MSVIRVSTFICPSVSMLACNDSAVEKYSRSAVYELVLQTCKKKGQIFLTWGWVQCTKALSHDPSLSECIEVTVKRGPDFASA